MPDEIPSTSWFESQRPEQGPLHQRLFGLMRNSVERLFLLDQIDRLYRKAGTDDGGDPVRRIMRALDIRFRVSDADRARIPETGPLVIVANHPFGGIEGIVLLSLLREVRPDVKVVANRLFARIPEMKEHALFVDPIGRRGADGARRRLLREGGKWVRDGHALLVFPAGEVSHLRLIRREVSDSPWSQAVARLVRVSKAAVLPVFIEGRNSAFFQMAGLLNRGLCSALLPGETLKKCGTSLQFRMGNVVPHERLRELGDDHDLISYLRLRTYILRTRGHVKAARGRKGRPAGKRSLPVARPLDRTLVEQDILLLDPDQCVLENEDFSVYAVTAPRIPNLIHELGRLREITFREVGEGTGREIDLDSFDEYYIHLILWSRKNRELVGSYRIGKTDEIVAQHGIRGLYTSTLFHYDQRLLDCMGPALEVGRSFIRKEYQRSFSPLLLLWKGMSRLMIREPRYHSLFGPVSITSEYSDVSQAVLESFLREACFKTEWARLVRPVNPPHRRRIGSVDPALFRRVITEADEVSELISQIESDQKGVPVLIRQYLKLGGKILGFNVDPEFSHVLDGLIWVDLLQADPRLISRFLGKSETVEFLKFHGRG